MKFKLLSILIIVGITIQFIPYGKEQTNPPVVAEPQWDSPETREIFFTACGSCHSNSTQYPLYGGIAPISWLIQHDVNEGRRHFNVSMWGIQQPNKGIDAAAEIQRGEMPPKIFVFAHPDARLSKTEKSILISGLQQTFPQESKNK